MRYWEHQFPEDDRDIYLDDRVMGMWGVDLRSQICFFDGDAALLFGISEQDGKSGIPFRQFYKIVVHHDRVKFIQAWDRSRDGRVPFYGEWEFKVSKARPLRIAGNFYGALVEEPNVFIGAVLANPDLNFQSGAIYIDQVLDHLQHFARFQKSRALSRCLQLARFVNRRLARQ